MVMTIHYVFHALRWHLCRCVRCVTRRSTLVKWMTNWQWWWRRKWILSWQSTMCHVPSVLRSTTCGVSNLRTVSIWTIMTSITSVGNVHIPNSQVGIIIPKMFSLYISFWVVWFDSNSQSLNIILNDLCKINTFSRVDLCYLTILISNCCLKNLRLIIIKAEEDVKVKVMHLAFKEQPKKTF